MEVGGWEWCLPEKSLGLLCPVGGFFFVVQGGCD